MDLHCCLDLRDPRRPSETGIWKGSGSGKDEMGKGVGRKSWGGGDTRVLILRSNQRNAH